MNLPRSKLREIIKGEEQTSLELFPVNNFPGERLHNQGGLRADNGP